MSETTRMRTILTSISEDHAYNGDVNVSDIGEFGLIKRLSSIVGAKSPDELIIGIGDDCAGEYGVTGVGGDVVSAPQTAVTVALIGRANVREGAPMLMRRDGACAG